MASQSIPGTLQQARASHNLRVASRNWAHDLQHDYGHAVDSLKALLRASIRHAAVNGGAA